MVSIIFSEPHYLILNAHMHTNSMFFSLAVIFPCKIIILWDQ